MLKKSLGRESGTPLSVFQTTEMWGRKCEGHAQTGSQFWWQRDQKDSQVLYNTGQKSKTLCNATMVLAKCLEMLSLAIFIGDFYMPLIMCHLTELQQRNLHLVCPLSNIMWFQNHSCRKRKSVWCFHWWIIQVQSISNCFRWWNTNMLWWWEPWTNKWLEFEFLWPLTTQCFSKYFLICKLEK